MAICFVLLLLFGLSGVDGTQIVGGKDAAPHSRPYMASLRFRGSHFCGGALIREDFVVTAAHCDLKVPITVELGTHSIQGNEETKQEFRAIRLIPHPNFNDLRNDIMLLKLSGKAQLNKAVQLIPLQSAELSNCTTAGWGDIGDNGTAPDRLQEVNVTILKRKECQQRWGSVPILSSMVCGVGSRPFQGFCSGDSGGPLVCNGAIAGVVSFSGQLCGDPQNPDIYTRISTFRRWIASVLRKNTFK